MPSSRSLIITCILLFFFSTCTPAFYLPGVAPHDYKEGEEVAVHVNSLTPMMGPKMQLLKSIIPYDYYYKPFHFCEPTKGKKDQPESLGSILFGDRIFNSPYELKMLKDESCKVLCEEPSKIPGEDAEFINSRIRENYAINWLIDGLPAASRRTDTKTGNFFYSIGFELGNQATVSSLNPSLHNHYSIEIQYHKQDEDKYRVVGVIVHTSSYKYESLDDARKCQRSESLSLDELNENTVWYTYKVDWKPSETAWATRWDNYLYTFDPRIHWFSLVNSIVIVLFLTGMVAMILLRALHKDISRYNQIEAQEDVQEDFGWKLVHGDVFRPPNNIMLLSVLLGSGAQLFFMTAVTLVFAVLGFLSPSNRGSLATVMIIFYMLFGSIAGYTSARVYKTFGGESWKKNVFLTAFLFPATIFSIFIILNFFLVSAKSSGAVPATTLLAIIGLWFLISVPLCCIGSVFGFKKPRIERPVRTNQIPRQIPDQVFYLRPIPSMLMGGVLPFGAIFIELYFIMNSIWGNKVYYLFGFAAMVFVILTITCSEVTILLCYFHLCAEDYHWSWRAFLTSGASGLYIFIYSIMYFATRLQITSLTSAVVYFGWTGVMSLMFFVLTGTIGYFACLAFIRKIFMSIKVD